MAKKIKLVMFDFDGTLSAGDSNSGFFKYCFQHSVWPWFFIPVIMVAIIAKNFNKSGTWWRQVMRSFINKKMVKKYAPGFIKQHKMERFGWAAERVAAERAAGNVVILISAGPDYLINPLVRDIKFDAVIASEMDKNHPWKYNSFYWGKNKVIVVRKWLKDKNLSAHFIRAYSDHKSDTPMMNLASEQVWIDPKTGCRK